MVFFTSKKWKVYKQPQWHVEGNLIANSVCTTYVYIYTCVCLYAFTMYAVCCMLYGCMLYACSYTSIFCVSFKYFRTPRSHTSATLQPKWHSSRTPSHCGPTSLHAHGTARGDQIRPASMSCAHDPTDSPVMGDSKSSSWCHSECRTKKKLMVFFAGLT